MKLPFMRGALGAMTGLLWLAGACGQTPASTGDVPAIAQAIKDTNSIYLGWRVFQANCSRCHGADATGGAKGPDLLPRVRPMSQTRFIGTVVQRYKWVMPATEASGESGAPDVLLQGMAERKRGELMMPAWEKEPSVKAHIADLYDYLQARANGTLAPGRPPWPAR
jgi:hypothetical protein